MTTYEVAEEGVVGGGEGGNPGVTSKVSLQDKEEQRREKKGNNIGNILWCFERHKAQRGNHKGYEGSQEKSKLGTPSPPRMYANLFFEEPHQLTKFA